jgi:RNA-binding protein
MTNDLTSPQRQYLKSLARRLETQINVGKGGVSAGLVKHIDSLLEARELVKIRLLEAGPADRHATAEELAKAARAALADVVGRVIVLYRPSKTLPAQKRLHLPE